MEAGLNGVRVCFDYRFARRYLCLAPQKNSLECRERGGQAVRPHRARPPVQGFSVLRAAPVPLSKRRKVQGFSVLRAAPIPLSKRRKVQGFSVLRAVAVPSSMTREVVALAGPRTEHTGALLRRRSAIVFRLAWMPPAQAASGSE